MASDIFYQEAKIVILPQLFISFVRKDIHNLYGYSAFYAETRLWWNYAQINLLHLKTEKDRLCKAVLSRDKNVGGKKVILKWVLTIEKE